MHVISRKALKQAALKWPDVEKQLDVWFRIAKKATWRHLTDVRKTRSDADFVSPDNTVFNIKGNAYRLIVKIQYKSQMIFIRHVLTHAEYTKGAWKK